MTSSAITKVEELVPYVPNISMSETGIGTNLYVRGIGSGINQGFEQSVGMYIDGIYYGRGQLTRAPFLDIAQVEALRGPQAILLGNNSIAGALNLTTAKPTDTFLLSADGLYEPDNNEEEINGVISGPLTDRLSARFAARYRTMDGYEDNVTLADRDEPNREEKSGRLTLAWNGDIWDATLKGEKNSFDVKGRQIEIIRALPSTAEAVSNELTSQTGFSRNSGSAQGTGGDYWRPGHTYLEYLSTFFGGTSAVPGVFNADTDYVAANPSIGNGTVDWTRGSNGDSSNNDIDAAVLTLNFELGDYRLTSITGYLKYTYTEICDCDFTGAPQFNLQSTEKYDQWSQELRIASPTTDRVHWLAGLYYQDDTLNFGDQIFLPLDDPYRSGVVRLVGYATTGNDHGADASLGNTSAFRNFDQNDYVSSVFGQVGMDITDRWRASLGARYTHMEKEASRILREGDLDRVPFTLDNPEGFDRLATGSVLFASIFKVSFHQLSGSRIENNTAYEFVTDFDLTDDVMIYGSFKTGFKSGGFDARSNSEPVPGTTGVGTLFPASSQPAVQNNVDPGLVRVQARARQGLRGGLEDDDAQRHRGAQHRRFLHRVRRPAGQHLRRHPGFQRGQCRVSDDRGHGAGRPLGHHRQLVPDRLRRLPAFQLRRLPEWPVQPGAGAHLPREPAAHGSELRVTAASATTPARQTSTWPTGRARWASSTSTRSAIPCCSARGSTCCSRTITTRRRISTRGSSRPATRSSTCAWPWPMPTADGRSQHSAAT